MNNHVRTPSSLIGGLIFIGLAASLVMWGAVVLDAPPVVAGAPDIYSGYQFGPKGQVLDLGIQPLWVPTSTISEAIKRDRVLERELAGLGLRARFHAFRMGPEGNAFLDPERLDGFFAGDMPALTAAAGKEVVIVTLVHQGFGAIVAKGVESIGELKGKKVAYAPGASTHFTLLRALKSHGLRPGDLSLAPEENLLKEIQSLASGQISAMSTWDPITTAVTKSVPGAVVLHRSLFEGYLYFTRQAVERNPMAIRMVIAAQIRAMAWMRQRAANLLQASVWATEEHERFSGSPVPLMAEEYAALVKSTLLDVTPLPEVDADNLKPGGIIEAKHRFLAEQGAISRDAPFTKTRDSFDRRMVEEVMSAPDKYLLGQFDYTDTMDGR